MDDHFIRPDNDDLASQAHRTPCPHCGGAGGWEGEFSPLYYGAWTECSFCKGTGDRCAAPNHGPNGVRSMSERKHEFVAYDENGDVVASQLVMLGRTLERFAAEFPYNDVAEVRNDREVRTIKAAQR